MTPTTIERAARMYHTNVQAAQALDLHKSSFARICHAHGIQTPFERAQEEKRRWTKKLRVPNDENNP